MPVENELSHFLVTQKGEKLLICYFDLDIGYVKRIVDHVRLCKNGFPEGDLFKGLAHCNI